MSEPTSQPPDDPGESRPAGRRARANEKRKPKRATTRSAGHVRAGAKMLSKEAKKILKRHRARLPEKVAAEVEETVERIDELRGQKPEEDLVELEHQAEHLDELLHQHASFARKSALRDSLENIGIAIAVALAVRSCVYEPFKIPSGSMMPTLRAGDHIFVNKFVYGVQIPLTTTVVGEDMVSSIERGEVIVFRYPLDESDDFIKRVIGLPGDEIRVNQDRRHIEIKRAGSEEFEFIEREALDDQKCRAEGSDKIIDNCTVFRETLDGKRYEVRYRDDLQTVDPSLRTFRVPEGHLLVMGDNRNASHDSLAWTEVVDAVSAAGIVSRIDIRNLTDHEKSNIKLRDDHDMITANHSANIDRGRYLAERESPIRGLVFEAWRTPRTELDATFASLALHHGADEITTVAEVLEHDAKGLGKRERARLEEIGEDIGELRLGVHDKGYELLFRAPETDVLFRIECGRKRCARRSELVLRAARIAESLRANPDYDAIELLPREKGRADTFPGRGNIEERYVERKFGSGGSGVRLRAWRKPHEGLEILRDAALGEFLAGPLGDQLAGADGEPVEASAITDLGDDAWLLESEGRFVVVHADAKHDLLAVLECGARRCKSSADAVELATTVAGRFPGVAKEAEKLATILGQSDVGGLPEVPVTLPTSYYWDHMEITGSVFDDSHALQIEIEMNPEGGLEAGVEARKQKLDGPTEAVEGLGPKAWYSEGPNGRSYVFAVPETGVVVQLDCKVGMCPDRETARRVAERAYERALDPENFLQRNVSRPRPFVPRGNVKGRAEVIWWPTSRFGMKID